VAASHSDRNADEPGRESGEEAVRYPTNHVVGILGTHDQGARAVDALTQGGFLESEVELIGGAEAADRLAGGTGRRGFQDWFIRLTGSVGLKNAETELKDRYEQALRDGNAVLAVLAASDDRKHRAAEILKESGGRFINFFGQLNVERLSG
jgi:hypothetical protein